MLSGPAFHPGDNNDNNASLRLWRYNMFESLSRAIGLTGGIAGAVCAGFMMIATPASAAPPPAGFEDLASRLLPTVVNISTTTKIAAADAQQMPEMPELPPGSPFEQFFKDFYDQYKNHKPQHDEKVSALGSGFVIDAKNGYIVTNNHVIKDADEIKVILHDNTTLEAKLVGTDEKTDVAVLKVKPSSELVAAKWGDSDNARVGSWVIAIGNPFGLGGTVTAGIVSARQRDINEGPYDDFIQTDASINRGNSGGPMFNTQGEVVGVNTAIFSPSGGSVGIGFAIPSNIVKNVVGQLIKYGKTKRGWLGVRIQQVTPEIADSLGLGKARGAMISSVTPKGPAEAAGLKSGDVILTFNGRDIEEMHQLPRIVAGAEVGKPSTLTVWRDGAKKDFTVTLGQLETAEAKGLLKDNAPTDEGAPAQDATKVDDLGLSLSVLDGAARKAYDVPASVKGVVVTDVTDDGPAAEKGVREGDVIVEVDQKEVATPKDVQDKVDAAKKAGRSSILLFLAHKDDTRFVALKLKK
ncbi:MAG: Do family serine endopeptidase [Alphaproteobacteria bacterium]|nr:Do family serine endopeptidase [Alphaproteobacteria bacterium]